MNPLVDRVDRLVRQVPVVRRAAPSLETAWHAVDRTPVAYQTRRLAWRARHGRRSRFPLRVAFAPEAPRYFHGAYQLCVRLDIDVVVPAEADVTIYWADVTVRDDPPPDLHPHAINIRVRDISKRHVNVLHRQVFGYDLDPQPGDQLVEKSDRNATHDGRVVERPSGEPGVVLQRLIDNRLTDHLVTEHRVALMDGRIVMCAVRYRPATDRFFSTSTSLLAVPHQPDAYFSAHEQAQMAAMCDAIGADWAELDVLRDRTSRQIYVVDVNTTPANPMTGLTTADRAAYWRLQEHGFAGLLEAHAR